MRLKYQYLIHLRKFTTLEQLAQIESRYLEKRSETNYHYAEALLAYCDREQEILAGLFIGEQMLTKESQRALRKPKQFLFRGNILMTTGNKIPTVLNNGKLENNEPLPFEVDGRIPAKIVQKALEVFLSGTAPRKSTRTKGGKKQNGKKRESLANLLVLEVGRRYRLVSKKADEWLLLSHESYNKLAIRW
ncbi:ParE family toxin-like protein [Vibrio harveyi]|uniref:ParE family toxin-like protein n=1 Tax=Vibrio harveyi TaxID=669 RepID=UPI0018F15B0E|nr:hypothetical protein [Vibrio harveyi]